VIICDLALLQWFDFLSFSAASVKDYQMPAREQELAD
jgi:hypothetical protein